MSNQIPGPWERRRKDGPSPTAIALQSLTAVPLRGRERAINYKVDGGVFAQDTSVP